MPSEQPQVRPTEVPTDVVEQQDEFSDPTQRTAKSTSLQAVRLSPKRMKDADLKIRAVVTGRKSGAANIRVRLAQFEGRGAARLRPATVPAQKVGLTAAKSSDSKTVYKGTVSKLIVQNAQAITRKTDSVYLCVDKVAATLGSKNIRQSAKAQRAQGGGSCTRGKGKAGKPRGANSLITGTFDNAKVAAPTATGLGALTYSAKTLSSFTDRPERVASTLKFAELVAKKRWRSTFKSRKPLVALGAVGSDDLVNVRLSAPKRVGKHRYRSTFSYATPATFDPAAVDGEDLVMFGNTLPSGKKTSGCTDQSTPGSVAGAPNDSDFIGQLGNAKIKRKAGKNNFLLRSKDPSFFNWFLSDGIGCPSYFTGPADFASLATRSGWARSFGTIKPNSGLLWQEGKSTRVVTFRQNKPKLNQATGKWSSKVKLLGEDGKPSSQSVQQFIESLRQEGAHLSGVPLYGFDELREPRRRGVRPG